jgi:hypothetical protein
VGDRKVIGWNSITHRAYEQLDEIIFTELTSSFGSLALVDPVVPVVVVGGSLALEPERIESLKSVLPVT